MTEVIFYAVWLTLSVIVTIGVTVYDMVDSAKRPPPTTTQTPSVCVGIGAGLLWPLALGLIPFVALHYTAKLIARRMVKKAERKRELEQIVKETEKELGWN